MSKDYYSFERHITENNLSKKIVIDDIESYIEYPEYNIIYDKLWLSKSQNMTCGPMGVYPVNFPIIFKPIVNLYGLSRGFKKIDTMEEYDESIKDGFFWQPYFKGDVICLDLIVNKGKILFYHSLRSVKGINGSFQYHYTDVNYKVTNTIKSWINKYLHGFKGLLNLEIIDDNIIEAHLRLNGDFHYYDISFCKQVHDFFENDIDETFSINYTVPKLYLFPLFLSRNNVYLFNEHKKKHIIKILYKSDIVKTFYFDDINTMNQGNLLRIIYFDSFDFELGLKLKRFILNYILN